MYNYDRRQGKELFQQVTERYPEHPAGPLLIGVADWMIVRGTHGVEASEETLLVRIDEAAKLCEPYVEAHPGDPYGWLLYGMSLGIQARVDLARKHWVKAAVHGYSGIQKVKKAEELAPNLADTKLAMGAFHYYVGMSGALLKTAARIIGLHGTREEGKAELTRAANHGRYGHPEANSILMYIDGYLEDNVPAALARAESLTAVYSGSPYYWAMRGDFEYAVGDTTAGKASLDTLQKLIPGLDRFYQEEFGNKVTYLRGLQLFARDESRSAIDCLQVYLSNNVDEYDFHGINANLVIGRAYLQLGERHQAEQYLDKVTSEDIPSRMRTEAKKVLQTLE